MARCHTRCRSCRARQVLPKPPKEYAAPPHCRWCGKSEDDARYGTLVADKWMNDRDTKATLCGCDGYHFQYHRKGSLKCHFKADGSSKYGDPVEMPGIELPF